MSPPGRTLLDGLDHILNRSFKTVINRAGHQAVTDVELLDLRYRGDGHHVFLGKTMPRKHAQAQFGGMTGGALDFFQFLLDSGFIF